MISTFLSDASNQRKIAVALCAFLALFSARVPLLADVKPEMIMALIGAIATWIAQSGLKAAAQAHAEGTKQAALITNANDAVSVFNHLASGAPGPVPASPAPALPAAK